MSGQGNLGAIQGRHGICAHHHNELGIDGGEFATQMLKTARLRLRLSHLTALHDVRAVELKGIDLETLTALHESRTRTPKERHALV